MSYSDEIQVEDLSSLHKYRTELPNIIFEYGLDPYEGWLYMCLKKISGDNGGCFASNKYLSIKAKISERKIRYCKQALVKKGLIKITKRLKANGSKNTDLVQIIDLWPKNFIHFKEKFRAAQQTEGVRHNKPDIPAQPADKEKPSEEEPLKKKFSVSTKPAKISFSFKENRFNGISNDQVSKWKKDFPSIDIMKEGEKARQWVVNNPARNKKRKNWNLFFENEWFPRASEALKNKSNVKTQIKDNKAIYDRLKPIYDRYMNWFEASKDPCVYERGYLHLKEDYFYESKFIEGKYNLDYDKFITLLKKTYVKSKDALKMILNG